MMKIAGMCVVGAMAASVFAQQPPKKGPPKGATKPPAKVVTQPPSKKAPPAKAPPRKQTAPKVVTHPSGSSTKKTIEILANGEKVTTTTVVTPASGSSGSSSHRRRVRRRRVRVVRRGHHTRIVSTHIGMTSNAETGLVGIRLFDSGMKVLEKYGNPDMILNLGSVGPTGGGGNNGGAPTLGGGGGVGARGPGGGGARGGPGGLQGKFGGGARGVGGPSERSNSSAEYSFQDDTLERAQFPGKGGSGLPPSGAGPGARFGGGGQRGGPPANFGGGQAPAGGAAPGNNGTVEPATYTRWVYKHGPSQYAFIIDKLNRVVQIEVVGMGDANVRTNRGITFGATFKQLMHTYGNPDAFEIGGDNLVLRYLAHSHVAFRLNRLQTDKPHEVTAIVVAGGKG
ncbi:MAG TPA: hypothetical protein VGL56_12735 [Fimbriimonadaceae bacterium]